jgi:hypothetical protein
VAESVMKLPTTLRRAITALYGNEKALGISGES